MGWFDRFFRPPPIELRDEVCAIRRAEVAELLQRPTEPYLGDATSRACEGCGRAMPAALITTGGPLGDPAVWRDAPVAVDGWACVACGVFHYPRRMQPADITGFVDEGVRAGAAGDHAAAEWWFTRVVWDWPGYIPAHVNLAEATRRRLVALGDADPALTRRLVARMRTHYEEALEAHARHPDASVEAVAQAAVTLAEIALNDRAPDRARRALAVFAALPPSRPEFAERAETFRRYLDDRLDLFDAAADVLMPYIDLQGRTSKPLDVPRDREVVVQALADLAEHRRLVPGHWRTGWMLAKGRAVLGDTEGALALWRELSAAHPGEPDVAREASSAMLRSDHVQEALAVNRAICERVPDDATLWCNRAVCELLVGDLAAARACLDRSDALNPDDRIAKAVRRRLDDCEASGSRPRTLRELEGR